jgi:hypothetical protein
VGVFFWIGEKKMPLDKVKAVYGNETQVKVEIARATGANGIPGTFAQVCVDGVVNLNQQWSQDNADDGTTEVWCLAVADAFQKILFGTRSATLPLPLIFMPSDTLQNSLYTDWENKAYIYTRVTYTDSTPTTPATKVFEFKGKMDQWNLSTAKDQVTKLATNFIAEAVKPGGGWT